MLHQINAHEYNRTFGKCNQKMLDSLYMQYTGLVHETKQRMTLLKKVSCALHYFINAPFGNMPDYVIYDYCEMYSDKKEEMERVRNLYIAVSYCLKRNWQNVIGDGIITFITDNDREVYDLLKKYFSNS